jgi:heme-degrading monooxygenase HmoA
VILERATVMVRAGTGPGFEAAVARGAGIVAASPGFRSLSLHRGIEDPDRYLLLIEWETVEDHTVGFRGSDAFGRWRAEIGPYLDGDPDVEHFAPVELVVEVMGAPPPPPAGGR